MDDVAVVRGIVVWVVAEYTDVVAVVVHFLRLDPHAFAFIVTAISVFGGESKDQFDVLTGFDIRPNLFLWGPDIRQVLRQPLCIFEIISVLRKRREGVIFAPSPAAGFPLPFSSPAILQIMQFHESRIELDHVPQANKLAHGIGSRIFFEP